MIEIATTEPLSIRAGNYREIVLTGKNSIDLTAIIDAEFYPLISSYKWQPKRDKNKVYARRTLKINGQSYTLLMHHVVLPHIKDRCVDHINGNGLDNRICNLRLVTLSQNHANRISKKEFKGVRHRKDCNRWEAYITCRKRRYHIGLFVTAIDAAKAYNKMAEKLNGDFARLNKVD